MIRYNLNDKLENKNEKKIYSVFIKILCNFFCCLFIMFNTDLLMI